MGSLVTFMLLLLPIGQMFPHDIPDTVKGNTLSGAYGVHFGMSQDDVLQTMRDQYNLEPDRKFSTDNYIILEFEKVPGSRIHRLRIFIHPQNGVFVIEEEIKIRWDLQQADRDNLEHHQKRLNGVLKRLRRQYGEEVFLEETDLDSRFAKDDFVTTTWSFAKNRWIHVIYEPQDWELYPELNKIIVIYRDSDRDPRDH